ncbi:MAG: hypothetical protein EA418_01920 [Wenzhouxiangellaceae bacterium]|nr:MAG: hypothetical protein EA418_01920 [Wenzhouxiangellaceae bacterium]
MADSKVVSEGRTALLSQDGSIAIDKTDSALAQIADELLRDPIDDYRDEITSDSESSDDTEIEPGMPGSPNSGIQQDEPDTILSDGHGLPKDVNQELEQLMATSRRHATTGEFEQALAALSRILEISPTHQEAEDTQRRIRYLKEAADRQLKQVYELAAREQFNEARERLIAIKNANPRYPPVQEAEDYLGRTQRARSQAFQEAMGQMRLAMERNEIEDALERIEQIRQDFILSSNEISTLQDNESFLTGLLVRKNEARELFRSGEEKFQSHDYRGAIEDFRAAYWTGQNLWSMNDPEPNHYNPLLTEAVRRHERIFELLPHIDRAAKGDITTIHVNQIRTALKHVDELLMLQPGAPELLEYQQLLIDRLEAKIGGQELVTEPTPATSGPEPVAADALPAATVDPETVLTPPGVIDLKQASGQLDSDTREQRHSITVPRHGSLRVAVEADQGLNIGLQLFDVDDQLLRGTSGGSSTRSVVRDDLAPGTYYARVWRSSGEGNYRLSSQLTAPTIGNDSEPNNTRQTGQSIPVNYHSTGLLGYLDRGERDTEDWFRFQISQPGRVHVAVYAEDSLNIGLQLYDADGQLLRGTSGGASSRTVERDDLAPGTYYARVQRSSGQGGYVITPLLDAVEFASDREPNDTREQAQDIPLSEGTQGLLGYLDRGERDTEDWFRFQIKEHGAVQVAVNAEESLNIGLQLYDADGQLLRGTSGGASRRTVERDDLAPGTYYARVQRSSGQGGYVITPTLAATTYASDREPNDTREQAQNIRLSRDTQGLLGYLRRGKRDTEDWFRFQISQPGTVHVAVNAEESLNIGLQLYDADGQLLRGTSGGASSRTVEREGLAPGTYYARVQRSSGQGGYVIRPTFTAGTQN